MKRGLLVIVALCVFVFGVSNAEAVTLYRLPLDSSNYQGINSWFDHDGNSASGMLRYDGATNMPYNWHKGTDFAAIMSNVPIRSGAYGSLYYRDDTCPPGYIGSLCGGGFGNHVRIEHADGKVTLYAHMVQGTVVGYQSISCGAYVGTMGTSGNSLGVHLHFELWGSRSVSPIDFFGGPYSNGGFSYWVNQNNGNPTAQCQ